MSWLSDRANIVLNHMPDWMDRVPDAPGGPGALTRAFAKDDWTGGPFQSGSSSWDEGLLMGRGPQWGESFRNWTGEPGTNITDSSGARNTGRGIGTLAALYFGAPALLGAAGYGGGGAIGAGEGFGLTGMEGLPSGMSGAGAGEFGSGAGAGTFESNPGTWSDAVPGTSSSGNWWQQGTESGGGSTLSNLFGRGGAGQYGIGGLFALLQGMQQRKRSKEPTLSDAERAQIATDAAEASNRSLSATVGNPALNPGAQAETQGRVARMLARMEYEDRARRRGELGQAEGGMFGGGGMLAQALMAYLAGQGGAT